MSRLLALVLVSSVLACKATEPPESTPTTSTVDLSTPVPPVDTERPDPIDTGIEGEET
jgi:hypothetical protein